MKDRRIKGRRRGFEIDFRESYVGFEEREKKNNNTNVSVLPLVFFGCVFGFPLALF